MVKERKDFCFLDSLKCTKVCGWFASGDFYFLCVCVAFLYVCVCVFLYRVLVYWKFYKVVGVVKWHWERDAWQRQTSVRKRLTFPLPPPPEGEEWITAGEEATDDSAEHGDMETDDGRPESIPMDVGSADRGNSSSSSGSSIESRVNGIRAA